ncbi:MAG: hypothetical protein AAGK17_10555 [Pseudomonadota bacterium]
MPPVIRDGAADGVLIGTARGDSEAAMRTGGDALRALDWSELTTRLNAARELRLLLRRDHQNPIGSSAASFGDAAARYFGENGDYERSVNLDVLEARKASQSIVPNYQDNATPVDARDTE